MVTRNTFSGTLTDENWNTTETANLNLVSDETTTAISSVYPVWTKQFLNSLYTTMIDAGYTPILNEDEYSIEIWGFKFYVVVKDTYKEPYIYIKGKKDYINFTHSSYTYTSMTNSSSSNNYNYTITIRGNEKMFCIAIGGKNYETKEYPLFWLAKAIYTPTNGDGFVCGCEISTSSSTYEYINCYLANDLYNIKISSYDWLNYINNVNTTSNSDIGVGVGYFKVPLTTKSYEFIIEGMIFTDFKKIEAGNYYKLGNEIYYANKNEMSGTNYPFLYKVDTVVSDTE